MENNNEIALNLYDSAYAMATGHSLLRLCDTDRGKVLYIFDNTEALQQTLMEKNTDQLIEEFIRKLIILRRLFKGHIRRKYSERDAATSVSGEVKEGNNE